MRPICDIFPLVTAGKRCLKLLQIVGSCVALTAAGVVFAQPQRVAPPSPALWVVRSGDASVYVFGRMPVLSSAPWFSAGIQERLDASDVLWVEHAPAEPQRQIQLVGELGAANGYSILNVVDERNGHRAKAMLLRAGLPAAALDGKKPWAANLFLSDVLNRMHNIDRASFPDTVLRARAQELRKPVHSEWGDVREALEYSAGLPEPVQIQMLGKTLDDSDMYSKRANAWLRADIDTLSAMANETAAAYPDVYREINAQRNVKWMERIREMLANDEIEFVSLDIGHLVGPNNVLSQLEAGGAQVQQVKVQPEPPQPPRQPPPQR